jgi:hypothetical protein
MVNENHWSTSASMAACFCSCASLFSFLCSVVGGAGFATGDFRWCVDAMALYELIGE